MVRVFCWLFASLMKMNSLMRLFLFCFLGRPISWAMIAPSITPKRNHVGPNNPSLRLYKFNKDTGQVMKYFTKNSLAIIIAPKL